MKYSSTKNRRTYTRTSRSSGVRYKTAGMHFHQYWEIEIGLTILSREFSDISETEISFFFFFFPILDSESRSNYNRRSQLL